MKKHCKKYDASESERIYQTSKLSTEERKKAHKAISKELKVIVPNIYAKMKFECDKRGTRINNTQAYTVNNKPAGYDIPAGCKEMIIYRF